MDTAEQVRPFMYKFLKGPVSKKDLLTDLSEGNCRLAVQEFFRAFYSIILSSEDIVLPQALATKGTIITDPEQQDNDSFFNLCQIGDIIYAQELLDSKGRNIYRPKNSFLSIEEWMRNFHMAVFLGPITQDLMGLPHLPSDSNAAENKTKLFGTPVLFLAAQMYGQQKNSRNITSLQL